MFSFDPTLTVGALLNAFVLLVGFVVTFTKMGGRIDLLSQRIKVVEETVRNQRDVNERLAVIETRQATHGQMIVNTQTDVSEMKRGRGFIQQRGVGVDGEYP